MSMANRLKDSAKESRIFTARLLVCFLAVLLLSGLLIARYAYLQIIQHEAHRTLSDRNRLHLEPVAPKRGLIYDRNGRLLAENQPSFMLTLVRENTSDVDATLEQLKQLIELDDQEIAKYKKRLRHYRRFEAVPLKFRLDENEIAILAVNAHKLPGVNVTAQLLRHYPHDELFAHSIGYVGRINDKEQFNLDANNYADTHHIGKTGLEKYYESQLHGQVGYQTVESNARGRKLRVVDSTPPVPGADLTLSLDIDVQRAAYEALQGWRGAAVALDPNTGGVIAIVSTPGFNPNWFVNGISNKNYQSLRNSKDLPLFNRALQGQYPPASTIKPVVALAGLENKIITASSLVRDPGWYRLPNEQRYYRDWKKNGHAPWMNMHMSIVESCDVYFYDLAFKLGIDKLSAFLNPFGLGQLTKVDQTSERKGLLPTREWKRVFKRRSWYPGETLNVGIGQGYMLTTPLQLAQMMAVIATRGKVYRPRLLARIGDKEQAPELIREIRLNNEKNWDLIINAMRDVIYGRKGTAKSIRGAPYKIAGKTGTAQVIGIAQDEEYDAEEVAKRQRDHALFISFAPIEKPQIAVAVIVENGEHGSLVAAPIARRIMDAYLIPKMSESTSP